MVDLAVIILTYNEEKHISRAMASVQGIAKQVFVIDSGSTDKTIDIARALGAVVLQHPFVNYAKQFTWALESAPIECEWVMRLDADEIIEPDLAAEIAAGLDALPKDITGVNLKRKHIFLGRWVRHGGRYPLVLLRIWRLGVGRIEDRWMDEHMMLSSGRAVTFNGGFSDHNLNDLSFFTNKHNKYASREAVDVLNQEMNFLPRDVELESNSTSYQAALKRWAKERVYNRIPFEISSILYFLYRYIILLGFLDGRSGLAYHLLQGLWYRFLVGAKVRELKVALGNKRGEEARARLSQMTGLKL